MEWFASRIHDDAFAFQRAYTHLSRFPRNISAMKLRRIGEDRLLADLFPALPVGRGVLAGGGETSATRGPATISVSVTGFVEKERWVSRRGGKAGDDLFVTGKLGRSIRGRHLRFVPRIVEARWLTKNFPIHAMMDLSDGLGADLPRLARASKLGFKIDRDSLPLSSGAKIDNAISDGEDYELLFAISPRHSNRLQKSWRKEFPKLALTHIGKLTSNYASPARTKHQTFF